MSAGGNLSRREAAERDNRMACQRDCTAASLLAAAKDERSLWSVLTGKQGAYSPWFVGASKRGGWVYCAQHKTYTLLEWPLGAPDKATRRGWIDSLRAPDSA